MGVSDANLSPVGDGGDAASCDADRTREDDVRLGAVGVAPRHRHSPTSTHTLGRPKQRLDQGAQTPPALRLPSLPQSRPNFALRSPRGQVFAHTASTRLGTKPRSSLSQIPAADPTLPR
ncbi:unnamed protein product, partial [Ixodes pacificus]